MGIFSGLATALQNVGVPAANIPTAVAGVLALSPAPAVNACLQVILANPGNVAIVTAEVTKLAEVPNLPASVAGLLPQLQAAAAAGNALMVMQVVQAIEAAMSSTSSSSLLNLL